VKAETNSHLAESPKRPEGRLGLSFNRGRRVITLGVAGICCITASAWLSVRTRSQTALTEIQQTQRVRISGVIVNDQGAPMNDVSVVLSGSASGAAITGATGTYSVLVPAGGNYTVTPIGSSLSFRPKSLSFANVTADQTNANFVATSVRTFNIRGFVFDLNGKGVSDVSLRLSASPQVSSLTALSGDYSFILAGGNSYTLAPSRTDLVFEPPSLTITNLNKDYTGINFIAIPRDKVLIRGVVLDRTGTPLSDVVVRLDGAEPSGTSTSTSGVYAFAVAAGGSYVVTPSRNGFSFNPPSAVFSNLNRDQTSANFVGTSNFTYGITGAVTDSIGRPIIDAPIVLAGSAGATAITDTLGNYSFSGLGAGSYLVTPALQGFVFSPPTRAFSDLNADQINVNFVGTSISEAPGPGAPSQTPSPSPSPSPSPRATATPTPLPSPTPSPRAAPEKPETKPAKAPVPSDKPASTSAAAAERKPVSSVTKGRPVSSRRRALRSRGKRRTLARRTPRRASKRLPRRPVTRSKTKQP